MNIVVHSEYEDETFIYNHLTKKNQQPAEYAPHFHDICELIFFKSGDMSYMVDGRRCKLQKNMLVISHPGERHCIQVDGGGEYERYNILFAEKSLPIDIYSKLPKNLHVINFNANQTVISLFDKMDFYAKRLSGADLKQLLQNLISELLYNIIIETGENNTGSFTQTNPLIYKAVTYIDENLLTVRSVEEICKALYITKSHLHHMFMKYLNITPKKYITQKRLALARREIAKGEKATEIALKCGFSDYSTFYRAYKKHFNSSPSVISEKDPLRISNQDFLRRYWD